MIRALHIEHYALIDQLDISLHSGFSVITGETGAGKSIILGAIGLLLGDRADMKAIKTGEKRCIIEAEFNLSAYHMNTFFEENDLDFDGVTCIVRRELTAQGKSRAFINDTPVALNLLREMGNRLIDIHSQHQNLLLGKEDFQLDVLDIMADNGEANETYSQLFNHYKELGRELSEAIELANHHRDEEDYLRFQATQLAEAELQEDEQETLEQEQETLSHAEEIKDNLYAALQGIDNEEESNTLQRLKYSMSMLHNINRVYGPAEELGRRLDSCYYELKDIAEELERQADNVDYDPQRLLEVNDRLNTIYSLEKKHRVDSVKELLELQNHIENQLLLIDNSEEHIEQLRKQQAEALQAVMSQAEKLTASRQKAGQQLETDITGLLIQLGMPNVKFKVSITEKKEPDTRGTDKVVFLFSANKNIPAQPLAQIASGGETARVMLSLKALIAGTVKLPTIIFDEIDTGVSGQIAEQMAHIMADMGMHDRQVISITHLPQIAARGQHHYRVYKEDSLFATSTHITELNQEQRVEEIAHMLSGATLTEAAINNARELLKQ